MELVRPFLEHSPGTADWECHKSSVSMPCVGRMLAGLSVLALVAGNLIAGEPGRIIQSVSAAPAFFNPSIGQVVAIEFSLAKPGTVDLQVVSTKGDVVRTLLSGRSLGGGSQAVSWDGKTESSVITPNDDYSVRITWSDGQGQDVFDPTRFSSKRLNIKEPIYDVSGGLFTYELPAPSRITLEASCLSPNPTAAYTKTIVAGEPRVTGRIVEVWNGYDKTGKVFMPDCPGFHVTVDARALPAPALITIGNRAADQEASRRAKPSYAAAGHEGRP